MEDLKYILVRTDCTYSVVDIPEDDFLEQAYKLIGCDLIETLPIMGNEIFILDEEGKNNERDLLLVNLENFVFLKDGALADIVTDEG